MMRLLFSRLMILLTWGVLWVCGSVAFAQDAVIDVMVVYDRLGAQSAGKDLEGFATNVVANMNAVFANTNDSIRDHAPAEQVSKLLIPGQYRLVKTMTVERTAESVAKALDFRGECPEVRLAREESKADIVVILVEPTGDQQTAGFAIQSNDAVDAYAAVRVRNAIATYSAAHEVAHVLHCNHSRTQSGAIGNHAYAVGCENAPYHSLMSYGRQVEGQSSNRVPMLSGPYSVWQGKQLGSATQDNTRMVREMFAQVAAYDGAPRLAVSTDAISVENSATSASMSLLATTFWYAQTPVDWISIQAVNEKENARKEATLGHPIQDAIYGNWAVTIKVAENKDLKPRRAKLRFWTQSTDSEGKVTIDRERFVTVTQQLDAEQTELWVPGVTVAWEDWRESVDGHAVGQRTVPTHDGKVDFTQDGWVDTNVRDTNKGDNHLGWAAAAANLWTWWIDHNARFIASLGDLPYGYSQESHTRRDQYNSSQIYDAYRTHFGNVTSQNSKDALGWFFKQHLQARLATSDGKPVDAGILGQLIARTPVTADRGFETVQSHLFAAQRRGDAILLESSNRLLTVWGLVVDQAGVVTAVHATDASDDAYLGLVTLNLTQDKGWGIIAGQPITAVTTLALGESLFAEATLTVDTSEIPDYLDAAGGSFEVAIVGRGSWTRECDQPWVHFDKASALGEGMSLEQFSFDRNDGALRQATITYTLDNGSQTSFQVVQAGAGKIVNRWINRLDATALDNHFKSHSQLQAQTCVGKEGWFDSEHAPSASLYSTMSNLLQRWQDTGVPKAFFMEARVPNGIDQRHPGRLAIDTQLTQAGPDPAATLQEGLRWYLTGDGGYWREALTGLSWSSITKQIEITNEASLEQALQNAFPQACASGIQVVDPTTQKAHWLTVWGAAYNESLGRYAALYVTDPTQNASTLEMRTLTTINGSPHLDGRYAIRQLVTLADNDQYFQEKGMPQQPTFSASPNPASVDSAPQEAIVTLAHSGEWMLRPNLTLPGWLTLSQIEGRGNRQIKLLLTQNKSNKPRSTTIWFVSKQFYTMMPVQLTVTQAAYDATVFGNWIVDALPAPYTDADRHLLASPAGDGISNLMKYALGLSPTQAYPALPVTSQFNLAKGHFTVSYPKNPTAKGIRFAGVLETCYPATARPNATLTILEDDKQVTLQLESTAKSASISLRIQTQD